MKCELCGKNLDNAAIDALDAIAAICGCIKPQKP